jgi:hypothetical protein
VVPTRRALHVAVGALLSAAALTACIHGERLGGPSVSVRNDAGRPIVIQRYRSKWEIGAGETRLLTTLEIGTLSSGASFTILDAATCQAFASLDLTFETVPDPMIVVPQAGAPTARALTTDEQGRLGPAPSLSPNACVGPADGWNLVVVSHADRAFSLSMTAPYRGGGANPPRVLFDLSPNASGTIVWTGLVGDTVAGSIDLLDPATCKIVASVDHPAWGNFVVTIDEAGRMTIEPGLLPTDGVPLPGAPSRTSGTGCLPVGAPSGSPR